MKGKAHGRLAFLALNALLALVLLACSAAAPNESASDRASAPAAAPPQSGAVPAAKSGASAPSGAPGSSGANTESTLPLDRMIIRTVNLTLIVKDVEASITAVRDIAATQGGFVGQINSRYDGEHQLATMSMQVPSTQYDAAVSALRQLAVKVESENGSMQDVTEEFADLEAQVRNLQVTEANLQRLMDKATQMSDIIALQRELTNVRGEIERRQGRLQYLGRRTEMSTITVNLRPPALAKSPQSQWQPLQTARDAWEASLTVLLTIVEILIAMIAFLWWTIPFIVLAVYLIRRRRARRAASGQTT